MKKNRFLRGWLRGALLACLLLAAPSLFAQQRYSDGIDDALQYLPYATVVGLKIGGVDSRDDWPQLAAATAASWVVTAGVAYALKHAVSETRPDGSDNRSFPSGHSSVAFAGATMLAIEYGHLSPWIVVGGYSVATFVAVDRVARDRHHWYDVAAGAGIGVLSAGLTHYLSDKIFGHRRVAMGFSGNRIDVALRW